MRLTSSREHERVEKLLTRDREIIRELIPKIHPQDIHKIHSQDIKKKDINNTTTITSNKPPSIITPIPIQSDKVPN